MVRVFWIRFFKNCRNAQFEWVSALSQRVADLRSEVERVAFSHALIVSGWTSGPCGRLWLTGTRRAALRLWLLLSILLAAVVAIVALVVIYLGPIGATAVLTGGAGGGYGIKRFFCRRRRRCTPRR
jgi:hypothetical protein